MSQVSLIDEYIKSVRYIEKLKLNGKIDLTTNRLNSPTMFLRLGCYIQQHVKEKEAILPSDETSRYVLSKILDDKPHISQRFTYFSGAMLPADIEKGKEILTQISSVHDEGKEYGGKTAFNYLLGEILDNVYTHSKFEHAWAVVFRDEVAKEVEICFLDDGVTIPGNFAKHNVSFTDEANAVRKAATGTSTKNDVERGYGLPTTLKIVTKGLGGEALILSRAGGLGINGEKSTLYRLGGPYSLSGTIVSFRFPFTIKTLNIYDYVESKG